LRRVNSSQYPPPLLLLDVVPLPCMLPSDGEDQLGQLRLADAVIERRPKLDDVRMSLLR
jgi:hypothetical protein